MKFPQRSPGNANEVVGPAEDVLKAMSSGKRAMELLLEILIAVILVTAFVTYLFTLPKGTTLNWQRIALVVNTAVVFGLLISWFRNGWKNLAFWATITVLLLGHTAAYLFVLNRIEGYPLAYYVIANPVELALFSPVLKRVVRADKGA